MEVLTSDNMRKVVEEEGLEARNLLNWNVIVSDKTLEVPKTSKKPPASPRPQSASPRPATLSKDTGEASLRTSNRVFSLGRPKARLRSSSAGRNPDKCVRARYWAFLFENLYRAVDEIYQTCEVDESIVESKEAIMMLENYCKEFQALIQWLTISKNYEVTPPRNRPTSLAWEVRKSLPTKGLLRNIFLDKLGACGSSARRKIDLSSTVNSTAVQTNDNAALILKKLSATDDLAVSNASNTVDKENIKAEEETSLLEVSQVSNTADKDNTETDTEASPNHEDVVIEKESEILETKPEKLSENIEENEQPPSEKTEIIKEVDSVQVVNTPVCLPEKEMTFKEILSVDSITESLSEIDGKRFEVEFLGRDELQDYKTEVSENKEKSVMLPDLNANAEKPNSLSEIGNGDWKVIEECKNVKNATQVKMSSEVVTSVGENKSSDIKDDKNLDSLPAPTKDSKLAVVQVSTSSQTEAQSDAAVPTEDKTPPIPKQNLTNKPSNVVSSKVWKSSTAPNASLKTAQLKPTSTTVRQGKVSSVNVTTAKRTVVDVSNKNGAAVVRRSHDLAEKKIFKPANSTANLRRPVYPTTTRGNYENSNINKPTVPAVSQRSRPSQHHLKKDLPAANAKTASNSSSNQNASGKTSKLNSNQEGNINTEEDSDGWETVRGRTRCKNSPAKKLQPSNTVFDRAVAAKISQNTMGGFPYTCTSNSQTLLKKPSKPVPANTKKIDSSEEDNCNNVKIKQEKSDLKTGNKSIDQKPISKRVSKENIKPEIKKSPVVSSKQVATKGSKSNMSVAKNNSGLLKVKTVERPSTMDNVKNKKSGKVSPQTGDHMQRAKSSSCLEMKKKSQNADSKEEITKVSPTVKSMENIEVRTDVATPSSNLLLEDIDATTKMIEDGVSNIELATSHEEELESKSQALDFHQESECGNVSSDDQDCGISPDELTDDTQTLEMYEKMILEEAQEHVSELGLSWGDQMDLLDMELRTPGRALQMHEKLSSPFQKRTPAETIQRQKEKQLKAQEQRERFLEEKAQRFKDIQKKVEEMKAFSEKKQELQRISLEQRLQRAEEKRKKELEKIVKKAHDEEEKVNEIAFINSLEAQNKRHDLISKEKDHEARLQDIQGERQRKLEEKAAKEAAAEERRKVLEAERQARLLEMQEKRKQRDLKIEQQFLEKEKERQELANQKARDRELRISALNAAQQATVEELQKKIQLKQEESARRHEENMEQIRQKAFELSVRRYSSNNDDAPKLEPYETKKICTICNVLIGSEVYLLSHLRGKKHQEMIFDRHQGLNPSTEELELYNLKHIVDASSEHLDPNIGLDKERQKALKKRCKRLRQRMANKGAEFQKSLEADPLNVSSQQRQKILKLVSELKKFVSLETKNPWDTTSVIILERTLLDLNQFLSKCAISEKIDFRSAGGLDTFMELLIKISTPVSNNNTIVPTKIIIQACKVSKVLFHNCFENSIYVLLSNKIGLALDVLNQRLRALIPDNFSKIVRSSNSEVPPVNEVTGMLLASLGVVLDFLAKKRINNPDFWKAVAKDLPGNHEEEFHTRVNDVVSYIVSIGMVDRLSHYFNCIRGSVDNEPTVATFLLHSMSFLMSLIKLSSDSCACSFDRKKTEDTTQLLGTLKLTDLVGAVSLLYCMLLHGESPSLGEIPPPELPPHTFFLTLTALRMLNYAAVLNIHLVQSILGSEGLSLQFRHIANYLLWYCRHRKSDDLRHEVVVLLGFFSALNPDNQLILQAGQGPSMLKQLSSLPFSYFCNSELTDILFPTLISCCYNCDSNKSMLQQELSVELLSNYIEGHLLDTYNSKKTENDPNIRWRFPSRFPKYKWTSAKQYFANSI